MPTSHLAIDFGAGSGRAMLGVLSDDPKRLSLEEVHRFEHAPQPTPTGPVWDLTSLWRELLFGLKRGAAIAKERGMPLSSVGVDTWGVDWTLVEPSGQLIGLPHAYRDPANQPAMQRVIDRMSGGMPAIYSRTGIQPQPFNTLFQLEKRCAAAGESFARTSAGAKLLLLPDLLHFWLSGVMRCERTNASTTMMLAAETREWDIELVDSLGLPSGVLAELIDAGTSLGPIRTELAEEFDLPSGVQVIVPGTHDTASAVAAVPAIDCEEGSWAYLSSGTWSLLGVESAKAVTTTEALATPLTNELGVGGRTRLLRNIGGLWLVQELKRDLERRGEEYTYAALADLAEEAEPLKSLVDPNDPSLASPGGSIEKLQRLALEAGFDKPETPGELTRCCLESLALCYAETIGQLEKFTGKPIYTLYVVGGGVNNELLNRLTADATGRAVVTGPSEATAIGNLLVQAMGTGRVSDQQELRRIVAGSFPTSRIEPDHESQLRLIAMQRADRASLS